MFQELYGTWPNKSGSMGLAIGLIYLRKAGYEDLGRIVLGV